METKVDVAIQSFKKPESLIYTCLTLKEFCGDHIDTIYISDDQSNDKTLEYYSKEAFLKAMAPIKICVRENEKRAGLRFNNKRMLKKRINNVIWYSYDVIKGRKPVIVSDNKKYIYLTHDDVEFSGDVIGLYLEEIQKGKHAIVGDLGQCWRCPEESKCDPYKICSGYRPTREWPRVGIINIKSRRACRINEWSCLVDAEVAKQIANEDAVFFGTYEDRGDIGAYWFDYIVKKGYSFSDPLCNKRKQDYYQHCWQGFPGFSTEIYGGNNKYDGEMIKTLIQERYGVII